MRSIILGLLGAATLGFSAQAETVFLIVGNEDYRQFRDVRGADDVTRVARSLSGDDATVFSLRNGNSNDMARALSRFESAAGSADTLVVVLAGSFAHTASDTYFLASDAQSRTLSALDSRAAYALSTIGGYLGAKPGRGFLVLAEESGGSQSLNAFVDSKIGDYVAPQGVTVVRGDIGAIVDFTRTVMAEPGAPVVPGNGVWLQGFVPDDHSILEVEATPAPSRPTETGNDRTDDINDWLRAKQDDTAAAYQRYLLQHPNGDFRTLAQRRLAELRQPARLTPEQVEDALALSRDARREIQRDLSLLDFNTRGIDGIFGGGTRTAIRNWQNREGLETTGFLTEDQIARLDDQAARRAAELEAEARERRRQQLAQDRAYWDETGALGRESGYRDYLERYPDGEFADVAQRRLAEIEDRRRDQAGTRDREVWDRARQIDSVAAYRDYLDRAPNGAFRAEARQRIRELREAQTQNDTNQDAVRAEDALNLNPVTRRVIEGRLEGSGFNPGRVDGVFDDRTRRAIRQYQASRNLPQTGYLSETVVVRLLADSVRSILD